MLRRVIRQVWGTASLALMVAAAIPALASATPPQPDSRTQPLADGCQRNPTALIAQQTPEWTYVYNTPSDQPPPPPQWVSGTASSFNPKFQAVHTSGADFAFGHSAYDYNLNILPDPGYSYLMASPSNAEGNGEETQRLHTEWEDLTIPKFAWAEPGDQISEKGSWVWDCGHWGTPTDIFSPDYDLPHPGGGCPFGFDPAQCNISGERTEFHPYRATWVEHRTKPNSPSGDSEAELFVSTEKTKAGKVADCAHKFPPPPGGAAYPPAFRACVETEPDWQDVSGDYSFLLPAPPRPSSGAKLVYRAVDEGSSGAPAPTLAPEGDAVRVTFHLDTQPLQRLVMGYRIFAGWDTVPMKSVPTHLRVSLDRLDVHRAMDPGCSRGAPLPNCSLESTRQNQATTAPGDWNLYWDVNGIWGQWPPGELLTNDGDSLKGSQSVDLYVPPGKGWRLYAHGRECDINAVDPAHPLADCPTNREAADDNDVQGMVLDSWSSAKASLGTHTSNAMTRKDDPTSTCPDANPSGCYSLTYTVRQINDAAARMRKPGG